MFSGYWCFIEPIFDDSVCRSKFISTMCYMVLCSFVELKFDLRQRDIVEGESPAFNVRSRLFLPNRELPFEVQL